MAIIPIIKYVSYDDLVHYMRGTDFIIEPSIENSTFEFRGFNQDETVLFGMQYKLIFFNLYCTKYKNKELDGMEEQMCHKIGDLFINQLKNSYFKVLPRMPMTKENVEYLMNRYSRIIIKDPFQKYFSNNLNWKWVEVVDPLTFTKLSYK